MNKILLVVITLLFSTGTLISQCLKGIVKDEKNESLAFANVVLLKDTIILKVIEADVNGEFEICPELEDRLTLVIEYIGKISYTEYIQASELEANKLNTFILKQDPDLTILACPVIRYNKTFEESDIIFNRKEFEYLAGAYEDPARLILKYPGFAISNDQANGIVNAGIAPSFTKWTLDGLEIVNPNHLSNAGTLSDLSAASAGGVNALSGNIMGRFAYLSNPNRPAFANALSGIADIQTKGRQDNYISLGLLGLESGWQFGNPEKGPSLLTNYRYSFVGVLSAMGVDFGGESIAFQDLFIKTQLFPSSSAHQFSLYYLFAYNKNDHAPVREVSESTIFKDLSDIQFDGRIQVLGMKYAWKDFIGKVDMNVQFSYSFKEDSREASLTEMYLDSFPGFNNYAILEEKLLQCKWNTIMPVAKGLLETGVLYTFSNQNQTLQKNIVKSFAMDQLAHQIRAYIQYERESYQNFHHVLGANFLLDQFTNESLIEPYISLKKYMSPVWYARIAYAKNSQTPLLNHSAMAETDKIKRMKTNAFQLQLAHASGLGIGAAANLLSDLPESKSLFYHGFNEFGFEEDIDISFTGKARNISLTAYSQNRLGKRKGLGLQGNFTVISSQFKWEETWYDAKYDFTYAFNCSISKSFGIQNSGKWNGNVNIAYYQRGGIFSNKINTKNSVKNFYTDLDYTRSYSHRAKAYSRVDFRIVLQKDMKKRFFRKQVLSLDIQNLLNKENEGFDYFDLYTGEIQNQNQLGMIPVLSYKLIFSKA